jgi:hypothetical protein
MKFTLSVLALLAVAASPVRAQSLPVLEVPFAIIAPKLSASPTDPAWEKAAKTEKLTHSFSPGVTPPPVPATQTYVLWDKDYLYVRFVATDNEIYTPFTERDALHYQGDVAEVFFDPVGDGRLYYEFQLSARGGILDQYIAITGDPVYNEFGRFTPEFHKKNFWSNIAWNCEGLRTATQQLEQDGHVTGWIAEFALPAPIVLKRTGQTNFAPGTLRANFLRYEWVKNEGKRDLLPMNWSPVLFGCPHISPGRMGFLVLKY